MPTIPNRPGKRTLEIREEQRQGIPTTEPERRVELLLMELRLYGFACAKEIARLTKKPAGHMECPMCSSKLYYSTAESNGHFAARCSRAGCIKAME